MAFQETPYKFSNLKSAIRNPQPAIDSPLTFEPIFIERMWGGRRLESEFHKKLPLQKRIGESWEMVDRAEAPSIVFNGPPLGMQLQERSAEHRDEVLGNAPD